ncbi:ATP-grasp domain-containing protein [Rummeliibacillus pycnus]|uniref:ATP-grasp domain-containing protein n=1 Tax=Rummeliibacillus pycnus TaxID=101070 RepID=UPI003D2DB93F
MTKKIYVLHENNEWTNHLEKRLEELNLPYETWHLDAGTVNLSEEPPEGIFYNRMSASSHTRDHRYAPELTGAVIDWLEFYGRKVLNGSNALRLELSKVKQYTQLEQFGIQTPKTVVAVGKENILTAAKSLNITPFITKHNRAGKGLGVQLFYSLQALEEYVNGTSYEEPVDGITLIQQYIKSPESFITRVEFVGGKNIYSVRVDTSEGFELCPADACQIGDLFCPAGEQPQMRAKFEIVENPRKELIEKYGKFLTSNGIEVAGIEFIVDENGTAYTYDVNTNTNYNSDAEANAQKFGMLELAKLLGRELEKL